jgi:hypothetical protein
VRLINRNETVEIAGFPYPAKPMFRISVTRGKASIPICNTSEIIARRIPINVRFHVQQGWTYRTGGDLSAAVIRAAKRDHIESCLVLGQVGRIAKRSFGVHYDFFYRRAARLGSIVGAVLHAVHVTMIERDHERGTRLLQQHGPLWRGESDLLRWLVRIQELDAAARRDGVMLDRGHVRKLAEFGSDVDVGNEAVMMVINDHSERGLAEVKEMLRRADASGVRGVNEARLCTLRVGIPWRDWLDAHRLAAFIYRQPNEPQWLYLRTTVPCERAPYMSAAARAGHRLAILALANEMIDRELEKDTPESVEIDKLLLKAARDGHTEVLGMVGLRHAASPDRAVSAQAKRWVEEAAKAGDPQAMVVWASLLEVSGKTKEATRWLKRSRGPRPCDNPRLYWKLAGGAWWGINERRGNVCLKRAVLGGSWLAWMMFMKNAPDFESSRAFNFAMNMKVLSKGWFDFTGNDVGQGYSLGKVSLAGR